MLKRYQQQYALTNRQFILLDKKGAILESDQTLFEIKKGSRIFEFHPFFESMASVYESESSALDFFGVHLTHNDHSFIVDIGAFVKEEGLLLIITDLTDHYNAYQKLTQTRNESVIKTELTILKNHELEERERFKNSFIQNFSHELRNPMTSIMAIVNLLENTEMTAKQQGMLEFLKESNSNLSLMLEDTLSIGMIDAGKLEIQQKLFDLHRFFELIQFTYNTKAKKKGLEFNAFWDSKIPRLVEGDRLRLFQTVTNLLDNALKFTKNGTISFQINLNQKRANTASLRFQVSDTGTGISEENQKEIFKSFHRIPSNENRVGVGLGLTIVEKLLALMDSKIQVRSKVGEGATFYFDIAMKYPLFPKPDSTASKEELSVLNNLKPLGRPKFRLLLVEDNERVQNTLFKILFDTKKFQIDLVYDGAVVLQEVVNNAYDVILMDVNLPNLNGVQITKLIKDFPFKNINSIPIIGITANAYQENLDQCLKAGMDKVLVKPFEKEDLFKTLHKVLR